MLGVLPSTKGTQRRRSKAIGRTPWSGVHPGAAAPKCLGIRLFWRGPHRRRPRPTAASQAWDRMRIVDQHRAQRRLQGGASTDGRETVGRLGRLRRYLPSRRTAGGRTWKAESRYPGARENPHGLRPCAFQTRIRRWLQPHPKRSRLRHRRHRCRIEAESDVASLRVCHQPAARGGVNGDQLLSGRIA
jgi:hypothetical protein